MPHLVRTSGARVLTVLTLAAAVCLASPATAAAGTHPASAQGKQKGKSKSKSKDKGARQGDSAAGPAAADGFDAESVTIIRDWFSDENNLAGLPPGLAKREQLPPGLQRQLAKNGALPPGLQKKLQPLPPELERRLPRLPEGRKRIVLGGNVILLDETTSLIVDVLTDVLS